jgi:hypothetical protein
MDTWIIMLGKPEIILEISTCGRKGERVVDPSDACANSFELLFIVELRKPRAVSPLRVRKFVNKGNLLGNSVYPECYHNCYCFSCFSEKRPEFLVYFIVN